MLHVPIRVLPCEYGHGTFAAVDIPEGTLIWSAGDDPDVTILRFTDEQATALAANGFPIHTWGTGEPGGTWELCVDGSQFMNHRSESDPLSNTVTCFACGSVTAARDIPAGEEIRYDYTMDETVFDPVLKGLEPSPNRGRADRCANPGCASGN